MKIRNFAVTVMLSMIFCNITNCQNTLSDKRFNMKPDHLELFLVIGQSNMAGRAEIEVQDRDSLEHVFLFTGLDGQEWEKAANPLNKYSTVRKDLAMQKLGPGYTFARKIAEAMADKQIGLVVNARGGSAIAEWMPGTWLYSEAVQRTKMAMKNGTLKGIIWHQGSSDASRSDSYPEKIALLINSLRGDFNLPDLPFIAGQLSEDKPERKIFNQMILTLPGKVKRTAVVTAEGTFTIDGTHFDSNSTRKMGERYAVEMLKLLK